MKHELLEKLADGCVSTFPSELKENLWQHPELKDYVISPPPVQMCFDNLWGANKAMERRKESRKKINSSHTRLMTMLHRKYLLFALLLHTLIVPYAIILHIENVLNAPGCSVNFLQYLNFQREPVT